MSDAVYPVLPGLAWSVIRTPQWSDSPQKSKSGRRYAVGDRLYPTWKYRLPYEVLRQSGSYTELATLIGFVNQRRGRVDDFLYRDPDDFTVAAQAFGVGDGVTRVFPLVRSFGGFVEPVLAADALVHIAINGTDVPFGGGAGQFNVDAASPNTSTITFGTAPSVGAVLTWTGTYYWRCSLTSAAIPFEQFMKGLWKADIEFESHA